MQQHEANGQMPTCIGESGFKPGRWGFGGSPVCAEPGSEAQIWPVTRGEAAGAECQEAMGAQSACGRMAGLASNRPPSGSQVGMAVTRLFVPCYEKELKAETAFSPRGIPSASHSQAINSWSKCGWGDLHILIYTFRGVSESSKRNYTVSISSK